MTKKQKEIFEVLFRGGHIVKVRPGLYTARNLNLNAIRRGNDNTIAQVVKHCKKIMKHNSPMWILDKKAVLKLRATHWVKKRYKQVRDQQFILQEADKALAVMQSFPVTVGFQCQPCTVESAKPVQIDLKEVYDHMAKILNNTN
jgi:hypothetical protein